MKDIALTRVHLDTLSTEKLIELADYYNIDIPEGLSRNFIIGELLEIGEEILAGTQEEEDLLDGPIDVPLDESLPDSYNETRITALMRDPGWIFVYWDFHAQQYTSIASKNGFQSFFLRVNYFSSGEAQAITDSFDIDIKPSDRKWYIHLDAHEYSCRIELYARNRDEPEYLLAKTAVQLIPGSNEKILHSHGKMYPPLIQLSGIEQLQKLHFRNHRQSFG
ncbi:DUF4912 domain-containing protein [Brucepastera parasyntrophica]|uniref:DUF4912 domain-containing protein n=1 Tax=Brucepastera parasyntrophica TaxID=2880008 RepID=UPI002109EB9E|nr:DUF4912 domain-containing protein [Brucepastera parasyntrophica]ULQ60219.1 DUF4912 domain-containing protein [Brucepastera parasyntrophica]